MTLEDSGESKDMMVVERRQFKIVFVIILFFITIIFSFIPIIFVYLSNKSQNSDDQQSLRMRRKRRVRKDIVSLMNCFASGVFLSVCLLDLLPEVEEKCEAFINSSGHLHGTTFPLPQFFIVVGFLLLLILEQSANSCKQGSTHNPFHYDHGHHEFNSLISSTASTIISHHNHHQHQEHAPTQHRPSDALSQSLNRGINHPIDANVSNIGGLSNRLTESAPLLAEDDDNLLEDIDEELERVEKSTDPSHHSHFRYVMLAVVLSIHSVFEGLALGLETKKSTVVQLFAGIAIHKSVVAFSLGLNLVQSSLSSCSKFTSLSIFCLASPIGAVIGICVEIVNLESGVAAGLIGLLQALACGSFIYIVFFELLPHEFFTYRKRPNSFLKILSLILGLTLLSILMLFGPV